MYENVNETNITGLPLNAKSIRISLVNRLGSSEPSDRKAIDCKSKSCRPVPPPPPPGLAIGLGISIPILVFSILASVLYLYRK